MIIGKYIFPLIQSVYRFNPPEMGDRFRFRFARDYPAFAG
jgi:hypothetical protein